VSEKDGSVSECEDVSFNRFFARTCCGTFWSMGLMVLWLGRGWRQYATLLQGGLVWCRRFLVFVIVWGLLLFPRMAGGCGWFLECGEEFDEVCMYAGG